MYGFHHVTHLANSETLWEKLSAWYQNSLLCELLNYIGDTYFSVQFDAYDNFSISSEAGVTVRNAILAAMLGIVIAAVMTAYYRNDRGPGGFVRHLLKEEVYSPEKAKTLLELGYFRNPTIRRELARGSTLRMVVRCREAEEAALAAEEPANNLQNGVKKRKTYARKTTKIDFRTAHFYIPEELRHRADVRFDKKGSDWGRVIATAIVTIGVASALCWLLPDVLHLADNLINILSPS
ncbi:MAG: hypothetical protein IJF33_07270 [Clostridia bacterium]|nr:hypothetical protein [Clostridia bacterium]